MVMFSSKSLGVGVTLLFLQIVTGTSYRQTQLSLTKICKTLSYPEDSVSRYEFTITPEASVDDIKYVLLSLGRDAQQVVYRNIDDVREIPASRNTILKFEVSEPQAQERHTIIITVHNADHQTIAYLRQNWTPQDIDPKMTWIGAGGSSEHKDILRVNPNIGISFSGEECRVADSPCYFLHYEVQYPLEVCAIASDVDLHVHRRFGEVLECDTTHSVTNSPDLKIEGITLTLEEDTSKITIKATYEENSETMEVVLHKDSKIILDFTCEVKSHVECEGYTEGGLLPDHFSMMMVALQGPEVTESFQAEFTNYGTEVQILSDDLLEVRWRSDVEDSFEIQLDIDKRDSYTEVQKSLQIPLEESESDLPNEIEDSLQTKLEGGKSDSYREILVTCGERGGQFCRTYFLDLKRDKYTISVRASRTQDNNVVAKIIDTRNPVQLPPKLTLEEFTEVPKSPKNKKTEVTITVTSSEEEVEAEQLFLVVIEPSKSTQGIYFMQRKVAFDTTKKEIPIGTIDVPDDREISMILTARDGKDQPVGVGRVDAVLKKFGAPVVNEVGSEDLPWLRVDNVELDLYVNELFCSKLEVTYSLKPDGFKDALSSCFIAGENLDTTPMLQCRNEGSLIHSTKQISLQSIQLTYPENDKEKPDMTIKGAFTKSSNSMEEILIRRNESYSSIDCQLNANYNNEGIKACELSNVDIRENMFSLLMVALDGERKVTESVYVDFIDYDLKVEALAPEVLFVQWTPPEHTVYYIYLDKDVSPGYATDRVRCGPQNPDECRSYFLYTRANTEYRVSVKKDARGDLNIVEKFVTTPAV